MGLLALAERERQDRTIATARLANAAPPPLEPPAGVVDALKRLVDFIPTETIALFWVAVPASTAFYEYMKGRKPTAATEYDWIMFFAIWGLTPILLMLVYLSKLASDDKPPPGWSKLPWWRSIASVIAFPTWALAVPGNPFVREVAVLMLVWVGATVISVLLTLADPIIMKWWLK